MSIYPEVFVSITSQAIRLDGWLRNPNWDDDVIQRWRLSHRDFQKRVDTASSEGVRLLTLPSDWFGYIVIKTRFQECMVFNPLFFLNCVSVICNFPFIFVFYSCFQNSQIQMSCFHTWILLICQAIAMMTFCLSLRTTETMCILPSFSLVHTCVAAQRGILTLLFHKRRKKKTSQLDPVVHSPLSSSQNCFC